jgi:hypothetical protein
MYSCAPTVQQLQGVVSNKATKQTNITKEYKPANSKTGASCKSSKTVYLNEQHPE